MPIVSHPLRPPLNEVFLSPASFAPSIARR